VVAIGEPPDAGALVAVLLPWFAEHARDLPWRRSPTPWNVLVSEVMLQQTRVDTVLPYFERFLARWPDLATFAAASDEEVLSAWAGLGYYSRARRLLATARAAAAAGGLPDTLVGLLALPGVGPYTAGAVASIAFGRATAVVDGNVERVISRIDRREEDPRREGKAPLWQRVADLHEADGGRHPGALNQALMELGATVCTPRKPACGRCPVSALCVGKDLALALPHKAPRKAPGTVRLLAVVVRSGDGRVLLARRPTEGLFGGMWEPPCARLDDGADALTEARRIGALGARPAGVLVHVLTHRRLVVDVVEARALPIVPESWCVYPEHGHHLPEALPLAELARRILATASAPQLPLAAAGDR
jgi:A/G-specific adenine glycosylase